MQKKYSAAVCTLGCRVNQYESDCIISGFIKAGFEIKDFSEDICDVYVINTCTVTAGGDKKSKQMLRRAKKQNPNAIIAVCGCFSQKNPDIFKSDLQADIILGTSEKMKIPELALDILNGRDTPHILVRNVAEYKAYENINTDISEKTRAYIKIQDGCGSKCSYCIIPQVRGSEKSREYSDIYAEVKRFSEMNYHEIVLTGIEISSYGIDLKNIDLISLLEKLNGAPDLDNISTIRLSSIDPAFITKNFTGRLANLNKVANHLHVSLQSGSTKILNSMRRKYNSEQLLENINYAREKIKDLNITADIIVGFPGETDADFEKSLEMAEHLQIYHAHIFTYSKRPGTPAANYTGQVPEYVKNIRSKQLSKICGQIKEKIHSENINREFDIILEDLHRDYYTAKTKNFMDMKIENHKNSGNDNLRGTVQRVKTVSYDSNVLYGSLCNTLM